MKVRNIKGYMVACILIIAGVMLAAFIPKNGWDVTDPSDSQLKRDKKPNIILILVDDMGQEVLGTYGSAEYNTPNLDKLAKIGVKFTNMFAQPLCTPSRVKLMTGEYNFRNYTAFGYLKPDQITIANILQDAGYTTMIAGKWQLNGRSGIYKRPGWNNKKRPYHFGFDEYCLWQVARRGSRYSDPLIIQNGHQLPTDINDYGPDIFSNFVLNFIEKKKDSQKPFYIYYPMVLIHNPFVPTPDTPQWNDPSKRDNDKNKFFNDEVAYADKIVGKIMNKLLKTGLAKNTLVIFLGDNGTNIRIHTTMKDGTVVHGMKGHMVSWGTRVPAIAWWKGKSLKGKINKTMLSFVDILPTILDVAKIPIPIYKVVDGRSFSPQILGNPEFQKKYIYMYYNPYWGGGKFEAGAFARTETYKLYGDGRFYNMKKDVKEQYPIPKDALNKKQHRIRKKLKNVLDLMPTIEDETFVKYN